MNGKSLDITAERLAQLKMLFPEAFSEDKIDFRRLQEVLGEGSFVKDEYYELMWAGKSEARREAQKQTTATLIPDRKNSIDFDNARHIFIEGENLEVLRILQKSYFGKIKMIYIDPPYNTGNDSFVYPDNYTEKQKEYQQRTGIIDDEGYLNKQNIWQKHTKENGQFHSIWLSMMYPRLYLARNLMREDGLIFISIDDNEANNLKLLCDEIFGEENLIGNFVWRKKAGAGADAKLFFRQHEYIFLYAKNKGNIKELYQPLTEEQKNEYANPDNDKRGAWAATDLSAPAHDNDPKRIYEVVSPTGKIFKKCWAYTRENFEKLIAQDLIWWGKNGDSMPKRKRFLSEKEGLTPRSWIDNILTQDGKKDLKDLHLSEFFDYPKPVKLIRHFLSIATSRDSYDIILDFFAGSGTTAHAVIAQNNEDGGNRQFITVQIPEILDENTPAFMAGYRTISEVTRLRINSIIHKAGEEKKIDSGVKAFSLAQSNFNTWQADISDKEQLVRQLQNLRQAVREDCLPENMLFELILKMGVALNTPYRKEGAFYIVKDTWICFEKFPSAINELFITAKPQRIIALSSCFDNDAALTNLSLAMEHLDISLTII